ncbi:MAG: glycosyltransferase [Treponema sp.]|nr:glycosyltransferase [Treponema sp.]
MGSSNLRRSSRYTLKNLKVAIVHDWLVNYGGAESVVESILKLFPDADIFTLLCDREKIAPHFQNNRIITSNLQRIPFATKLYTKLLKFMPRAFESFDFSDYDLVISSSSSCAKGIITPIDVPHIAYIHTPMRYAWDLFFDYQKRSGRLTRFFMNQWMSEIRMWDYISSQRIDILIANSSYIAHRIKKFWAKEATVIYPPVHTENFFALKNPTSDYYITFSRLVPYKRIDLAILACKRLGKRLVVIGGGSEAKKLKSLSKGGNITFTGRISYEEVLPYLQNCKALIFPAEEDFGITPLEVQSCGRPVIAFGKGGATETVIHEKTGILFEKQTTESLCNAITLFEKLEKKGTFKSQIICTHAKKFNEDVFLKKFQNLVTKTITKKL